MRIAWCSEPLYDRSAELCCLADRFNRIADACERRLAHQRDLAAPIADYVLALHAGRVVSFEPGNPTL